ncbi:hypothetical protein ECSTECS1191_0003 [Escherichia coli STEC_S1191]|nr:hypothetical protein ECSTECS1191_0003 [Escherichia coli STEC_S1191]
MYHGVYCRVLLMFSLLKALLSRFPVVCQGLRRYEVVSTDHLFGNIPEENFLLYPVA